MTYRSLLGITTFVLIFCLPLKAQLNVNYSVSYPSLVSTLVGSGIYASNITYQLDYNAKGVFTATPGLPGFDLQSGIVLSTGYLTAITANSITLNSFDLASPGDTLLDALVSPLLTEDAQVLEFDFKSASDSVNFNFIFASEEYNDYVNTSFTDVFAFYVSGPGYAPNTNVAIIPGTMTPIAINTINNGQSQITASGPCVNCNYYYDNVNTGAIDFVFDGATTKMNIKFPVEPCKTYHFKIAIADTDDGNYDSAVFLEGSSFSQIGEIELLVNGIPTDVLTTCLTDSLIISAPNCLNYSWNIGDTTQSIVVTQPGTYSFITFDGTCVAFSAVTIIQEGTIQAPVIVQAGTFLTAPGIITGPGVTYQWNLAGTPIVGETNDTILIPGNGCYTISITEGSCTLESNIICITNTAIEELMHDEIIIKPHPVNDISVIQTPFTEDSETRICILDITGKILYSNKQSGSVLSIQKNKIAKGTYLLQLENNRYSEKIMRKIIME